MKQGKRNKSAAAPVTALDADSAVSIQQALPDAAYVEALLAASAPASLEVAAAVAVDAASDAAHVETVAAPDAVVTVAADAAASLAEILVLPAQCTMRDAVEFKQQFLDRSHAEAVVIDATAVERIDTAFMQLLLALARSRATTGNEPIAWLKVNAIFAEAAQVLGVQSMLAMPDVSAAA